MQNIIQVSTRPAGTRLMSRTSKLYTNQRKLCWPTTNRCCSNQGTRYTSTLANIHTSHVKDWSRVIPRWSKTTLWSTHAKIFCSFGQFQFTITSARRSGIWKATVGRFSRFTGRLTRPRSPAWKSQARSPVILAQPISWISRCCALENMNYGWSAKRAWEDSSI